VPGATLTSDSLGPITINKDRSLIELTVTKTGDRPIQVGSHYALVKTNASLVFNRRASIGMQLNVLSGASVRCEAGEIKTVTLVEVAGNRRVVTGNKLRAESGSRGIQAARGLGHDSVGHRRRAYVCGRERCAGYDPYGYAEREWVCGRFDKGYEGQDDSYVPYGGCGWGACSGYYQDCGGGVCAA